MDCDEWANALRKADDENVKAAGHMEVNGIRPGFIHFSDVSEALLKVFQTFVFQGHQTTCKNTENTF